MRTLAIFSGIAGALLLTTMAGSACAQVRIYPDGSECNDLTGGALVTCQNQVYSQQLESGVSQMAADPAEVQSSHIDGNEAGQSDFVAGAEGTALPDAAMPTVAPTLLYGLPGPEGARVYGPTE
ncbi:hypothetical protein [Dongia sp. agr-C8]